MINKPIILFGKEHPVTIHRDWLLEEISKLDLGIRLGLIRDMLEDLLKENNEELTKVLVNGLIKDIKSVYL